jgi:urease accessory protein
MSAQHVHISCEGLSSLALLRLQSWLSPTFPNGAYSYSHGLEWAVEAGDVNDRESLVDWLDADLCHGSARNEAIFFSEAYRSTLADDMASLMCVAELAAVSRGTSEFALESSQQAGACLSMLSHVWPDRILQTLSRSQSAPVPAVILGARLAREEIPLGQTDGQLAMTELESTVLHASALGYRANLDDLGSAGFMVELSSIAHETQYTRLFRS